MTFGQWRVIARLLAQGNFVDKGTVWLPISWLDLHHAARRWTHSTAHHSPIKRVRNIGIIAHVDAGKTTTTERMLYITRETDHIGNVDSGDTVTDYMVQERERGITIQCAAVSFFWQDHHINLIDTPGHVDFMLEVERALRVLDGSVVVLDASAGVQSQTVTVWRQAHRFGIPSIIYLNKMDKPAASLPMCMRSVADHLKIKPVLINLPLAGREGLDRIVDLVSMKELSWPDTNDCRVMAERSVGKDHEDFDKVSSAREEMISTLAECDESFADHTLSLSAPEDVEPTRLIACLRACTIAKKIVPVLCGSSFRNKGVQPLLSAVCRFLPSPDERHYDFLRYFQRQFCALAFKCIHDPYKGCLTFIRVYDGTLRSSKSVFNVNQNLSETVSKLYVAHGDKMREVPEAVAGDIVVLPGLKQTITGDTLVDSQDTARKASRLFLDSRHSEALSRKVEDISVEKDHVVLIGVRSPSPVFYCSVEPESASVQSRMEAALSQLMREDPSMRARFDEASRQYVIEGMGKLHVEVLKDRLLKEFKVKVFLSKLHVNYKETISTSTSAAHTLTETIDAKQQTATLRLSIRPDPTSQDLTSIHIRQRHAEKQLVDVYPPKFIEAVQDGCIAAASCGPLGFQMVNLAVTLEDMQVSYGVGVPLISACANKCFTNAALSANSVLLEPVMNVEVTAPTRYSHAVLSDLAQRRSQLLEMKFPGEDLKTIILLVPLAELHDYSSTLRTLTSGTASLDMQFHEYVPMNAADQERILNGR